MAETLLTLQKTDKPIDTSSLVKKLKTECKHIEFGKQADADEFIRDLFEAMDKAFLSRDQTRRGNKETISHIFKGILNQSVSCSSCGHKLSKNQEFGDLSLTVHNTTSLKAALDLYFSSEQVNRFNCNACKKEVSITKQNSIEHAPKSLYIHLKKYSAVGAKLNSQISIPQLLNLTMYSSKKDVNEKLQYRLVSLVKHCGQSSRSGHYVAMGLTKTGSFYQFNDESVRKIRLQDVQNSNPYMLFYELAQ